MMNAEGLDASAALAVTCAGPEEVAEAELDAPPALDEPATPAFADAVLTAEEAGVAAAAEFELRITGSVLLFADAWLVTATLRVGVGPVEVATTTLCV